MHSTLKLDVASDKNDSGTNDRGTNALSSPNATQHGDETSRRHNHHRPDDDRVKQATEWKQEEDAGKGGCRIMRQSRKNAQRTEDDKREGSAFLFLT
jgi:hypothetical protein